MVVRSRLVAALLGSVLLGCPPDNKSSPSSASSSSSSSSPAACTKVGQTCTYAPGKLGSCVQKDDCPQGESCFSCQSQH